VLTYRWIDELQDAAFKTLGSIAGRAIGYLAPEVALGGAIVSAGLIETDALDRDGVAAYLNELAESNPALMDHMSDSGGLLEGMQMRSLLTAGVLATDSGGAAARGGLRAIGVDAFPADATSALRDAAAGFVEIATKEPTAASRGDAARPTSIEELMANLVTVDRRISVQRTGAGRYIAYLPGSRAHEGGRLRLVGADTSAYVRQVVRAIEQAIEQSIQDGDVARVMLVGSSYGGAAAAEIAASATSESFVVDQVVTVGAPAAQVPSIPEQTRVLSLEDRADPVALLGSLINAAVGNRVTVIYDGSATGAETYLVGGRAADEAQHPGLRAEVRRIRELGYLAG
jgi:dienelactone hydrolase